MKISTIIPVFNGERFLSEAIESILSQRHKAHEIIVVDDGSVDQTADIAKSFSEVRYQYQERKGVAVARNQGIAAATGTHIAFLDADDLWEAQKLKVQAEQFEGDPNLDFILSWLVNFLDPKLKNTPCQINPLIGKKQFALVTGLFRKEIFSRVGLFNPEFKLAEDVEWFARAKDQRANFRVLEDVLLKRRVHEHNISQDVLGGQKKWLEAIRLSILRKRKLADDNPKGGYGNE